VAYEVSWAEAAIEALVEAIEYISRDSPSYAAALVTRADHAALSLQNLPNRGRRVPEYRDRAVREIPVSSYRLIYSVDDRALSVTILAFVHQARSLGRLLESGE
jgi:plasmid stabilization system protein ParE